MVVDNSAICVATWLFIKRNPAHWLQTIEMMDVWLCLKSGPKASGPMLLQWETSAERQRQWAAATVGPMANVAAAIDIQMMLFIPTTGDPDHHRWPLAPRPRDLK